MARNLKEDDGLIKLILKLARDESAAKPVADGSQLKPLEAAVARVQELLLEHHHDPEGSRLRSLVPSMGKVYSQVDLLGALRAYDAGSGILSRRFVMASFREMREVLNLATVFALGSQVKLVTLDADDTIYPDGGQLTPEAPLIPVLIKLMRLGVNISLVTAASYPGEPHKFEARIAPFLKALALACEAGADPAIVRRFFIMGGECNYLLHAQCVYEEDGLSPSIHLREVPDVLWKDGRGVRWNQRSVQELLDAAERGLRDAAADLNLDVLVIRKPRAVGIIPRPLQAGSAAAATSSGKVSAVVRPYISGSRTISYEMFEEVALRVQHELTEKGFSIPFCVFNGGNDCFVDIGNKALGVRAIQALVGATPAETVHAGDRFTRTGNDLRTRDVASTLWVSGPAETEYLLTLLVSGIRSHRAAHGLPAIASGEVPAPLQKLFGPFLIAATAAASSAEASHPLSIVQPLTPVVGAAGAVVAAAAAAAAFTPPGTLDTPPVSGVGEKAVFSFVQQQLGDNENGTAAVSSSLQGGLLPPRHPAPPTSTSASSVAMASEQQSQSYVGATVSTPTMGAVDAGTQALLLSGLSLDGSGLPPPLAFDASAAVGAVPSLHTAAAGALSSSSSEATTGSAVHTPLGNGSSTLQGGISASPRALSGVYGLTSARAMEELKSRAASDIRSQWQSAGGAIVGEVRPSTPTVGSAPPSSSRATGPQ